ncbi:MAG TPA: Gfo/Idh/MocA family oxidoreductase [Actinomycetales bacterium]|nr:Gfo/Idh/MocA family oxidoreductase [Actinomycetales bacterium]
MAEKVRLGIIGLGAQGGFYYNLIQNGQVPNMEIGAICDIDESKKERADEIGVPFYTDYIEMLESGNVDAVVTTVPHYLHPEMGIEALTRGIHTLIEKPAGVYTKQADELFDFADTKPELKFGVFFNQRTNPLYIDLKELIDSGELGNLRHTSWIITNWWRPQGYYDQSEWRATWGGEGGGVLVNQAPHQLDLWQWLCGVPVSCFAHLAFGFKRDLVVEDEVNAIVDFGEGRSGHFMTCTNDMIGTDRLEILFDKGKIVVDDSKKVTITRLTENEQELSKGMSMDDVRRIFMGQVDMKQYMETEVKEYEFVMGQQHSDILKNFADAVLNDAPLVAKGRDGINGVRLANAMQLSAWTGQPVDMADFPAEQYLSELNKRIEEEGKFATRS